MGVAPEKPPVAMIMVEIVRATVKLAARTNTGPCVPDELQAIAAVHESRVVKVCGWRPHDGGAAHAGGRRTQTSKGGNRGRFSEAARQTLWGFQRRRSVAEVR